MDRPLWNLSGVTAVGPPWTIAGGHKRFVREWTPTQEIGWVRIIELNTRPSEPDRRVSRGASILQCFGNAELKLSLIGVEVAPERAEQRIDPCRASAKMILFDDTWHKQTAGAQIVSPALCGEYGEQS